MPSKIIQYLNRKVSRQLWCALLFSIILHLFIFNGLHLVLPSMDTATSVMTAELILVNPEKIKAPEPELKKIIKPKIKIPTKVKEKILEKPPEPLLEHTSEIDPLKPVTESLPQEAIDANNPEYVEEKIDVHSKPTNIESWYDVRRSIGGSKVGETHTTYNVEQGHYKISSISEAKGLVSLIYSGKLVQTSEGELTENGLQPTSFYQAYDNEENKTYRANFNWVEHIISLQTSKNLESAELPSGTQDILSVQYQFMFLPPLQTTELFVTTGKTLRNYDYTFEGEELITTQLGEFNTIHIIHRGEDDNDKTEMWLAEEYHYLPIRLRKYLKDGTVVEQEMRKTNLLKVPKMTDQETIKNTDLPPL